MNVKCSATHPQQRHAGPAVAAEHTGDPIWFDPQLFIPLTHCSWWGGSGLRLLTGIQSEFSQIMWCQQDEQQKQLAEGLE